VSLDTFQSPATTDTVIGVYTGGCGSTAMCNDDACATQRSQWTGVLDPDTYYVSVETVGETTFNLQFQHLPVAGVGTPLAVGAFTLTGTTVGATNSPDTCGDGPDRWYYWTTCPSDANGALTAWTCGGASYDTVLQLRNGIYGGGDA
jgi:hypothetical protein